MKSGTIVALIIAIALIGGGYYAYSEGMLDDIIGDVTDPFVGEWYSDNCFSNGTTPMIFVHTRNGEKFVVVDVENHHCMYGVYYVEENTIILNIDYGGWIKYSYIIVNDTAIQLTIYESDDPSIYPVGKICSMERPARFGFL